MKEAKRSKNVGEQVGDLQVSTGSKTDDDNDNLACEF